MNPQDEDPRDPEVLPEEIVHWQPNPRALPLARPAVAGGAAAVGVGTVLAIAMGAFAIGALAVGAMAIGRLAVGSARFRELEIDNLIVHRVSGLRR